MWAQNPPPGLSSKIVIDMSSGKTASKRLNPNNKLAFKPLKAGDVNEDISCVSAGYTAPIYR